LLSHGGSPPRLLALPPPPPPRTHHHHTPHTATPRTCHTCGHRHEWPSFVRLHAQHPRSPQHVAQLYPLWPCRGACRPDWAPERPSCLRVHADGVSTHLQDLPFPTHTTIAATRCRARPPPPRARRCRRSAASASCLCLASSRASTLSTSISSTFQAASSAACTYLPSVLRPACAWRVAPGPQHPARPPASRDWEDARTQRCRPPSARAQAHQHPAGACQQLKGRASPPAPGRRVPAAEGRR